MTGYRIGAKCFTTQQEAQDYQLSQVIPAITADGSLKMPVRQKDGWYYGSQKIQPTYPICSIDKEINDGLQIGSAIVILMTVAYCIRFLLDFIKNTLMQPERGSE